MERPAEKQTFKINIERRPSRSTIPTRPQPGEASHAICFGMDALARQDVRQADNNQESDVESTGRREVTDYVDEGFKNEINNAGRCEVRQSSPRTAVPEKTG